VEGAAGGSSPASPAVRPAGRRRDRAVAAPCRRGRERKGRRGLCSREKTTGREGKRIEPVCCVIGGSGG
jgi:hypothetical protein